MFQHPQLAQRQFLYRYRAAYNNGVLSPSLRAPIGLCSEEHELICFEEEDKRSRLLASLSTTGWFNRLLYTVADYL
jgi:hypothetical protein